MTEEVGRTELLQGEKTKGTLVLSAPADVWFHHGCCPGFGTRTEAEGQSHGWGWDRVWLGSSRPQAEPGRSLRWRAAPRSQALFLLISTQRLI